MASELAEYIVYLPLCDNDSEKSYNDLIEYSLNEIISKFGGFTRAKANEGEWISSDKRYKDRIDKIQVLVEDTKSNDEWFKKFKQILIKRFQQEEIFLIKRPGIIRF